MRRKTRDDLGLAITMLDSDRLRQWAEKLDTHGSDISHWADRRFVSEQLRAVAGRIEATVAEVGTLRELAMIDPAGATPSAMGAPESAHTPSSSSSPPPSKDEPTTLHQQIMNLPSTPTLAGITSVERAYQMGHCDARHAAAELASSVQETRIPAREDVENEREWTRLRAQEWGRERERLQAEVSRLSLQLQEAQQENVRLRASVGSAASGPIGSPRRPQPDGAAQSHDFVGGYEHDPSQPSICQVCGKRHAKGSE